MADSVVTGIDFSGKHVILSTVLYKDLFMLKKCMMLLFILAAFFGCWCVFSDGAVQNTPFAGDIAGEGGFYSTNDKAQTHIALFQPNSAGLNIVTGKRSSRNVFLQRLFVRALSMFQTVDIPASRHFACGNYFHEINSSRYLNDFLKSHIIVRAGPFC